MNGESVLLSRDMGQDNLVTFQMDHQNLGDSSLLLCSDDSNLPSNPVYHSVIHDEGQHLIVRELNLTASHTRNKDVRLHASGRYVTCHRWLLSAFSPLLRRLLYEADPYQSKLELDLFFPDFSYKELSAFVVFLYKGEVTIKRKGGAKIRALLWLLQMELSINIERLIGESTSDKENSSDKNILNSVRPDIKAMDYVLKQEDLSPRRPYFEEEPFFSAIQPDKRTSSKKTFYIGKGMEAQQVTERGINRCLYCSKNFKTSCSLKKHLKLHEEPDFKCAFCDKLFNCKETLVNHTRIHTGDYFVCKVQGCSKKFSTLRSFKDHENLHSGKETFLCHFCGENFATKKKLFNHKEKHKTTSDPCSICGKELKNLQSFRAHMKAHNQGKSYQCNVCGRAFKRRFDLTVHTRIHTGDKPYSCDVCGKSFSLTSTLSKHKKFHENASSVAITFPCSVCEKKFSSVSDLTVHKRDTHQSEFLIVDEDGNLLSGIQDNSHQVTIVSGGAGEGDVLEGGEIRLHDGRLVTVNAEGHVIEAVDRIERVHLRIPNTL